jgi:hypothetical protein
MRAYIFEKGTENIKCSVEKLEYNGQFMGENSVIVSAKSPKHIDFNIDDYVVFRGENFYLANIPTEKKTGDRNTKGDVFQYDNMKFMSVQYELNNADFNDFVGGSQTDISFTAQPNFSFVAATVTDLAQRIQVNMDRYYTGDKKWTIKVDNNYTTSDDNLNKLITISNITCWGALALFKSLYDTNFIVRGRTVTIGGSGSIKDITFKVGAYKGLWDMTRNSQTDQGIVTKLTSYGNTTNIHPRYYSLIGVTVTAKLTAFDHIASSYSLFFLFDLNHTTELNDTVKFNISGSSTSYELQGTWGTYKDYTFGCRGMVESFDAYKVDTTSAIYEDVRAKVLSVGYANTSVTFVSGARKDNISDLSHLSFDVNSKLPNNMNIMNLMLPAFPTQTLAEWVEENKSKYSWLQEYVNQGYTFSTERFYPCIYSKNKDVLGIRPHTEYFTSDDATHKDIYPSLQYFSDNRNQIISVVNADGTPITDEGLFQNGQTPQQIKITIHNLGFNFSEVKMGSTDPKLHMNSGYCGGRDFTIKGYSLDNIILTCDRVKDDSLGKYFPNVNSPLSNGDKFVITDIYMPTTYIDQASVTLLKWSLKWLAKNDYSVFSYQLTPDINFIKRHDDKITDKGTTFYRTVKEGDILLIEDTDIGVTGSITIDQIKITEGDGLLPKYEITLRDTKTVGTVQKIQQQIDAIVSGGVSGGYNSTQVGEIAYSALKDKFLSKVSADTAAGLITFLKGLKLGSNFSIDELGNAILNSISLGTFEHLVKGLGLYKNTSGHWCIECDEAYFRIKAVFEALEIRKMYSSAGNINISPSGSKITRVEWLDASGNITTVAADTVAYKCYFLADDGTTATTNSWQAKDYALCKTFNIKEGVYTNVSNQYYWRKVTDAGSGYITLGNLTGQFDEGSTIPQAGDSVVMRGSDTDGRKSYIEILSNDENAPAILMFADCMGFASKGQNTAIISPEKVQFATKVFKLIDYDNVATPVVIYKGVYDASKVYYYNNSVTYNGSLWVLDGVAVGASAAAGTEPKDGSTVWTKQVSKGEDGDSKKTYIHFAYSNEADGQNFSVKYFAGALYLGICYDGNEVGPSADADYVKYTWSRIKGEDGDSKKTYIHFAYSNEADGQNFSVKYFAGALYLGICYDGNEVGPSADADYVKYTWSRIKGEDGDSKKTYIHFAYSNEADGQNFSVKYFAGALYLGICYDGNEVGPSADADYVKYTWSRIKGEAGINGVSNYIWIKYADDAQGNGLSDNPDGKKFIGIAHNKSTATESETASDYVWSDITGTPGDDGKTYYTWIKYSDNSDGTDMYDTPTDDTLYVGIAVNQLSATEGNDKTVYVWSRFKGGQGIKGDAGKNGYSLYLSPSEIVVDTNSSGKVVDYTNAYTNVYFTVGDTYAVATEIVASSITCVHCTATASGSKLSITAIDDDSSTGFSCGSGYITFTAKLVVGKTTYVGVGKIYFSVNIYSVTSQIKKTNDSISADIESVKTRVTKNETDISGAEDDIQTLTQNTSTKLTLLDGKINSKVSQSDFDSEKTSVDTKFTEVLQTAESYSIKVGETHAARRNMLVGTAFRRKEEFTYNAEAYFPTYVAASCSIQKNAGYHGTNAIYINITEDTQRFIGLRWEGISITPGTTYMFSVLVKSPDITSFTQGAGIELRINPSGANKYFYTSIVPSKSGAWEQITWAFTVPDTVLNETTSKNEVPTSVNVMMYIVAAGKLYLCRPMMEQSDTFTGWSLSDKDFDYVGGNILPNSRLLTDLTGNNLAPNIQWSPTKVDNGYGDCTTLYEGVNDTTSYNRNILQWTNNISLKKNTDYMFSMWANGTGYVQMLLYCSTDSTNNPIAFVESSDGYIGTGNDGFVWFKLSAEYRRIWVHYRTSNTFDETVKMTFIAVRQQYDSTSELAYLMSQENTITVASPKLETGATVTNYSESGEDMVSKKALLATGIDVTNGKITATSDNFYIQNNSGQLSAAVDESGNLSAGSLSTLHRKRKFTYVFIKLHWLGGT